MKNLKRREKILISLLLIAVVSYAYFTFFLSPILDNASSAKDQISIYNGQLTEIHNIIANNAKYQEDYNKAMEKFVSFTARMPYAAREPEIVYNMKGLADKAGILLGNISIAEQSEGQATVDSGQSSAIAGLIPVQVNISFDAKSYPAAMSFVNLLETEERVTQINTISLNKGASAATGTTGTTAVAGVTANVGASFYYMKSTSPQAIDYKFNNSTYSKPDLFK